MPIDLIIPNFKATFRTSSPQETYKLMTIALAICKSTFLNLLVYRARSHSDEEKLLS
ncbi:hypothetical protein H6G17_17610 [Chroococcidiopsis sp. FACHB-1243]|uniref:hypothetical protein n=1 Tax=Chroococcidiopsis sp. [FACHB-1243] TaxID=2692781 RepID=UPI001786595C|nr:hypothetical protein [Chroococcidiopsis sp. [FACHB-1243]]MBD2307299.1 hypothetical protein [Chroococcidiopsis sp. [FACHB-1243]]